MQEKLTEEKINWISEPLNNISFEECKGYLFSVYNTKLQEKLIVAWINKSENKSSQEAMLTNLKTLTQPFVPAFGAGQKSMASIYSQINLEAALIPGLCKDMYKKEYEQVMLFNECIKNGVIKSTDISIIKTFLSTLREEKNIGNVLKVANEKLGIFLQDDPDISKYIDNARKKENIYSNPEDNRSIFHHSGIWEGFVKEIKSGVKNKDSNTYPLAILNRDGSVTFVVEGGGNSQSPFEEQLTNPDITDQIDFQRQKKGFQMVENKVEIFEKGEYNPTTNLTEYKFNISVEDLDLILKVNRHYNGYDTENCLLGLKEFSLKPGMIRLFPVYPITERKNLFRADGCQIVEMPSVQLMHILPDYDGKNRPFHWIPTKVAEDLSLDRGDFQAILTKICSDGKMLEAGKKIGESYEGEFILNPDSSGSKVRIVDMDEEGMRFYGIYGNTGKDELTNCKSVEINTEDFLDYARSQLVEKSKGVDVDKKAKIEGSIVLIDSLIQETVQKKQELGQPVRSPAASLASGVVTEHQQVQSSQLKSGTGKPNKDPNIPKQNDGCGPGGSCSIS